ncbi:hypothetical protein [Saccharothrix texasensis]|uniref:Secreted protein n=1 Tax=Saccharothrix texasensis TaxID=103734 RepID=A0A3N1HI57_9PSEU|nr:hypothetical protein [Saccharothrix texasensis]ROP41982.1 hypothetical protein EDD40_7468 [Saccharothrix texasensis]
MPRRLLAFAITLAAAVLVAPPAHAAGFEVNGYWTDESECVAWKQSVIDEGWAEVYPYGVYCLHDAQGYYSMAKY